MKQMLRTNAAMPTGLTEAGAGAFESLEIAYGIALRGGCVGSDVTAARRVPTDVAAPIEADLQLTKLRPWCQALCSFVSALALIAAAPSAVAQSAPNETLRLEIEELQVTGRLELAGVDVASAQLLAEFSLRP